MLGDALQRLRVILRGRARPWRDHSVLEAEPLVGDDHLGIEIILRAEPVAGRAGAERVVEREQPGLDLGDGEAGDRAGEFGGEDGALAAIGALGDHDAVGEVERRLDRIGKPRADPLAHDDAVNDDLDVVLQLLVEALALVEVGRLVDLHHRAVDLDAGEAAFLQIEQLLAVLALAAADDRRQEEEPRALLHRQDAVDHLRDGLALDRQPGRRRIRDADSREEQPHIVVDLGHRADRRARILRRRLLLDRDRRRQALDRIDVGLLHELEELPGIGRQALDIAALALGIDGVESERRLARARQPGDHHQAVARHVDVDVLEVVLARAANPDLLHGESYSRAG